jgi:protocatechuate 3,4-dioxygenase beta subunit
MRKIDVPDNEHELEDHDRGLSFDLSTMSRRRSLMLLGGAGLAGLAGLAACTPDTDNGGGTTTTAGPTTTDATTTTTAGATTTTATGSCTVIPSETGGPYPADGTNGPNVLNQSGIVRSDIRSSFGSYTGTAAGVPLTINLRVLSVAAGCTPLVGAAVYLWHCDRDGKYSLYSVTNQNYLRGVQATDANGDASFTSIFPACYSGRWPHIHFEVWSSVANAAAGTGKLRTSQLALPKSASDAVFATTGYSQSVTNFAQTSLTTDNVFSDGSSLQTPTMSGSTSTGFTANLTVPV